MYIPDYNIPLHDGRNIALLFNNKMYRDFSAKLGIEYEELMNSVAQGKVFLASNLPDLLLISANAWVRATQRQNATFDEFDADEWIDALGGLNSLKLADIFKAFCLKLLNVSPEQFEILWNKPAEAKVEAKETKKKAHR